MSVAPNEDRPLAAIGLMLMAFLMFTGIDTCAKWLVTGGMPTFAVVFMRYFVHIAIVLALVPPRRLPGLVRSARPKLEVMRAACLLGSTVLNFTAVQYLPLTLTATIFFTVPLWICALSVPLLGETVGARRWSAIAVGFAGVMIAIRPWQADLHWAVFISMGTALCAALYSILTRRLAGVDSTGTQQFYAAMLASVAIAPVAALDWQWPGTALDWSVFAAIGVFGWAGHQMLTSAHRFAPASTLAPFVYVQLLYMTISSWLIFDQPPDIWVVAGGLVVLASGLYVWHRERVLARR